MTRLLRSRQCKWPTAIEVRRSWQARSRICRAAAVPSGDFGPGAYLRPLLFVGRQSSCLHRIFTAQVYRVRCSPSVIGCVLCWGASHDRHHADIVVIIGKSNSHCSTASGRSARWTTDLRHRRSSCPLIRSRCSRGRSQTEAKELTKRIFDELQATTSGIGRRSRS